MTMSWFFIYVGNDQPVSTFFFLSNTYKVVTHLQLSSLKNLKRKKLVNNPQIEDLRQSFDVVFVCKHECLRAMRRE
jgi:hypothetical protein